MEFQNRLLSNLFQNTFSSIRMRAICCLPHTCACFASTTLPNESYFVNPPKLQCHLVSLRTLWRQTLRSKPPKAIAAATRIMIFTLRPAYQTRTSSDYHHSPCIRSHNVPSKLYLLSDIQFEIQYCLVFFKVS